MTGGTEVPVFGAELRLAQGWDLETGAILLSDMWPLAVPWSGADSSLPLVVGPLLLFLY